MKTFVYFRSTLFPPYDGEQEEINPGVWGKRLAEFLLERLSGTSVVPEEPSPEDWGWYLPVRVGDARLALCCGHQHDGDDAFLIFTDPTKPVVRRMFKKIDMTAPLETLIAEVDRVLQAEPGITAVEWAEE